MIRDDFEERGCTNICIKGKLWEFVARQPGVPYAHMGPDAPADWLDHASVGIDVGDVMEAIA